MSNGISTGLPEARISFLNAKDSECGGTTDNPYVLEFCQNTQALRVIVVDLHEAIAVSAREVYPTAIDKRKMLFPYNRDLEDIRLLTCNLLYLVNAAALAFLVCYG